MRVQLDISLRLMFNIAEHDKYMNNIISSTDIKYIGVRAITSIKHKANFFLLSMLTVDPRNSDDQLAFKYWVTNLPEYLLCVPRSLPCIFRVRSLYSHQLRKKLLWLEFIS